MKKALLILAIVTSLSACFSDIEMKNTGSAQSSVSSSTPSSFASSSAGIDEFLEHCRQRQAAGHPCE
jgi:hypothetical protein